MHLKHRLNALEKAGKELYTIHDAVINNKGGGGEVPLQGKAQELQELIEGYANRNSWFTREGILMQVSQAARWLQRKPLEKLLDGYAQKPGNKRIGLVYRPLFPLHALEDAISILLTGNELHLMHWNGKDKIVLWLLEFIASQDDELGNAIHTEAPHLKGMDGIMVWKYEENPRIDSYFSGANAFVREQAASAAVLHGKETSGELQALAGDMLLLFGLSHYNVNKLFVPEGYDFEQLMKALDSYNGVANHHKFANNHDYHRSLFMLANEKFLDNGFLLIRASRDVFAPIAVVHYATYTDMNDLHQQIEEHRFVHQWVANEDLPVAHCVPGAAFTNDLIAFKRHEAPVAWLLEQNQA